MTASDLGRGIENRSISPVSLAKKYLDAISDHPMSERIYTCVTQERAMQEAHSAEARAISGQRLSLLDGVPISWKDLFDSKGIKTEAGSEILSGRMPDEDAVVLKHASNAGMVCLGKTHMSELAFSGLGLNPIKQTTPCKNDLNAVSGGSSSGAAGSVAFSLAPIAIGSDTGGSVRIPAAWNDLVGLKTTSGDISLSGVVPLCPKFDTVGPLCRSVEDASLIYAILKNQPPTPLVQPKSLRLMALTSVAQDEIEDIPMAAFNDACKKLVQNNIKIIEEGFPVLIELLSLAGVIFTREAYATWGAVLETEGEKMFPEILERFMAGKTVAKDHYKNAWLFMEKVRADWARLTINFDAVILPSSPLLPPNQEKLLTDNEYYKHANLLALRNTRIANMLGLCSITLPTSVASCGFMIMGAPNTELSLLNIAAKIESDL